MPIKNYTSRVPAHRSIEEIQASLVKHGATGVLYEYEQGTGRIKALKFRLVIQGNEIPFMLPVEWRKFQEVLKRDRVSRWDDEDYVYRVAWRNIRDWVLAQMALFETRMVHIEEIFLPYVEVAKDKTLYENLGPKLLNPPAN